MKSIFNVFKKSNFVDVKKLARAKNLKKTLDVNFNVEKNVASKDKLTDGNLLDEYLNVNDNYNNAVKFVNRYRKNTPERKTIQHLQSNTKASNGKLLDIYLEHKDSHDSAYKFINQFRKEESKLKTQRDWFDFLTKLNVDK